MKETIFFALFESRSDINPNVHGLHDRRELFTEEKTLLEFHNWIEEHRTRIETEITRSVLIKNIQFIQK